MKNLLTGWMAREPLPRHRKTKESIDQLRNSYITAFRRANGIAREPRISYENGWWVFRYGHDNHIDARYRTSKFIEITNRLVNRSKVET
jgi:hypothetical protein